MSLEDVEQRPAEEGPVDDDECWSRRSSIDSVIDGDDDDAGAENRRHPTTAAELGFSVAEMQRALAVAERMCKENLSNKLKEVYPAFPKTPNSPLFARRNNGGSRFTGSPVGSPGPGTPVLGSRAGSPAREATPSGEESGTGAAEKTVGLAGTVLKSGRYVPPKQLLLYVVRMGSFTSAKKIPREDDQDDSVIKELDTMDPTPVMADAASEIHDETTTEANAEQQKEAEAWRRLLLKRCRQELAHWPPLLKRRWSRVIRSGNHHRGRHVENGARNGAANSTSLQRLSGNQRTDARGELRRVSAQSVECDNAVSNGTGSTPPTGDCSFRFMQWNLLSQALGTARDSFAMCPEEALEWDQRRYRMLEEVLVHRAEILCFQEVDHYKFLEAHLAKLGYKGSFYAKPDSPCVYIPDNNGPDGCAVFYDASKFELVEQFTRVIEVWKVRSNQVIMVNILKHLETNQEVCVATTHLKAKEGALLATIRHEEGLDLVSFVKDCAGNRPVIVCGDFNATPEEPVYAAMLRSGLKLGSAYACGNQRVENNNLKAPKEPDYTTWKVRTDGESKSTLDYIFYSRRSLQVDAILECPSGEDMGPERLPSLRYASDHLSLVCDFSFRKTATDVLSSESGALESSGNQQESDVTEKDGERVMRGR